MPSKSASIVNREKRRIGALEVGPLALGNWRLVARPASEVQGCIEAALDAGIHLIDTADVYGLDWGGRAFGEAESLLGDALKASPGLRERITLASKGGIWPGTPYDSSARYIEAACDASLGRMGIERIDLYQIHRPDMLTHPAELAEALGKLREAGKIGEVGVSNYTPAQTRALMAHLPFPLASTQPEFSAAHLDPMRDGTFDLCMETGLAAMAWSPLAGAALVSDAAAAEAGIRPELLAVLDELAEREGADRASVAIAFVLAHPAAPIAVLGTTSRERLAASPKILDVQLDRADCYRIVQASEGVPLP